MSHNQLTNDSLNSNCALAELGSVVKLDLSHNHLESVPLVLTKLNRLVCVYQCSDVCMFCCFIAISVVVVLLQIGNSDISQQYDCTTF